MSEEEKMLAGEIYDANYNKNLFEKRLKAKELCKQFNDCEVNDVEGKKRILYILQKFMMTSFSERLSLKFRQQISNKLISLALTKIFTNKTLKYAINRQEQVEKLTAQVEEAYSGRIIIQSFNQEEKSIENMSKITDEVAKATRKADFIMYAINPAIRFVNRLEQVVITIFAGKSLIEGKLTIGRF